MASEASRALRVGLLVVAAGATLALLVLRLSGDAGLLRKVVQYRVHFPTTQGLSEGAEVRFKGVTVGTVRSIDFSEEPGRNDIMVVLGIRRSLATRLDRHVVAELRASSPLGDKLVELRRPDVPFDEPLAPGADIVSKPPFEFGPIMDEGTDFFADLRSISRSLDVITSRLVAGEGLFGRLLKDKEFGDRTVSDLEATVAGVRNLVERTEKGDSLLGHLVADDELAHKLTSDFQRTSTHLEAITSRLERGEGTLGRLITRDEELESAITDLAAASRNFRTLSERLSASEGSLVHRLLFDEEYGTRVTDNLDAALASVASVTSKVDRGEGAAGRFLNEDEVYEGVRDVVRGIETSWFINYLLKRKQKKGFRERVDEIIAGSPTPNEDLLELVRELLEVDEEPTASAPADERTDAAPAPKDVPAAPARGRAP